MINQFPSFFGERKTAFLDHQVLLKLILNQRYIIIFDKLLEIPSFIDLFIQKVINYNKKIPTLSSRDIIGRTLVCLTDC